MTHLQSKFASEILYFFTYAIKEDNVNNFILTDDLEIHIIEIPKMNKEKAKGRDIRLKEWLEFLENPESEEVLNYMNQNENMKEAKEKLDAMSEDTKLRRLAELREKAILDEKEAEYTGYCKGKDETLKIIVKKMKRKGVKIETIMEFTNLSKEEIDSID